MASIRLDLENFSDEELEKLQTEIGQELAIREKLQQKVDKQVDYEKYASLLDRYKGWAERLCEDASYQLVRFEDAQRQSDRVSAVRNSPLHGVNMVVAGCRARAISLDGEVSALATKLLVLKLDMKDDGIDLRFPDKVFDVPMSVKRYADDTPAALKRIMVETQQIAKGLEVFVEEFKKYEVDRMIAQGVGVDGVLVDANRRSMETENGALGFHKDALGIE